MRRERKHLLALPAALYIITLLALPLLMLLRISLYEGGGSSGFGIGGFYSPGTWTIAAYRALLEDGYFYEIVSFSLMFGISVTFVTVVLSYGIAYGIHKLPLRFKLLSLLLVLIPKLANVLVIVYGLKLILSASGPVNYLLLALGIVNEPMQLSNNLFGAFVAKVYLILPYTIIIILGNLEGIDDALNIAARGLGGSATMVFRRITLPLTRPGILIACFISLTWGVGAYISPYLMGSPEEMTLAVSIQRETFENINWPKGAATAVLTVVTLGALMSILGFAVNKLNGART